MIGTSCQTKIVRSELPSFTTELGSKLFSQKTNNICFGQSRRRSWETSSASIRFTLKAAAHVHQTQLLQSHTDASARDTTSRSSNGVRLFIGLPLDAVSGCNTLNHEKAIASGLKALKLLGVEGVELPVWWGVAEKEAMGKYEWSGYLAIAEMAQKVGLKLHVSLCFHGSKEQKIPLPEWVSRIGETRPNMFFTDRSGQQYKECLSLSVDNLPVLDGKTPIQVYQDFCESFKFTFAPFLGSTITGITMGLGPDGELRYPSHHLPAKSNKIPGVGEFQCYDKNMLSLLKQHSEATGNSCWGRDGPHDAPSYDQSPNTHNFFKEQGGSWETPYGDFFLSWYSSELISHGNRILSIASETFSNTQVTVSGKLPLMHSWYEMRSHPSELTAGFYNTVTRNGYESVAEMFAKNSCKMLLPGMDLSDEQQPKGSFSRPELLLDQIKTACRKHEVVISGQNSSISGAPSGFGQIKKNLLGENGVVDLFTYQRMGAYFFSPEHFPSFTEFVRSLDQPELQFDELHEDKEEAVEARELRIKHKSPHARSRLV